MNEFLLEGIIAIAGAFISALIWLIRLEGKVQQQAKDLVRLENAHGHLVDRHQTLETKIMEKFSAVVESLARIEERLQSKQVSRDTKQR